MQITVPTGKGGNIYCIDSKCKYLSYEGSKCHFVPLSTPGGRDVQWLKFGGSYIQTIICITPEENIDTKIKTARPVMQSPVVWTWTMCKTAWFCYFLVNTPQASRMIYKVIISAIILYKSLSFPIKVPTKAKITKERKKLCREKGMSVLVGFESSKAFWRYNMILISVIEKTDTGENHCQRRWYSFQTLKISMAWLWH